MSASEFTRAACARLYHEQKSPLDISSNFKKNFFANLPLAYTQKRGCQRKAFSVICGTASLRLCIDFNCSNPGACDEAEIKGSEIRYFMNDGTPNG